MCVCLLFPYVSSRSKLRFTSMFSQVLVMSSKQKNMVVSMKDKLKALKALEGVETLCYIVCKSEF